MKTQSIVLVLAGILVGCGAGATVAVSWAGPTAGQWQCYRVSEFPDLQEGAISGNASEVSAGLNKAAPDAPIGSVIQIANGSSDSHNYLCAKN